MIRLGQRDWLSHDIMRIIAGLLLSERLGYSVRFENLASIPAKAAWTGATLGDL